MFVTFQSDLTFKMVAMTSNRTTTCYFNRLASNVSLGSFRSSVTFQSNSKFKVVAMVTDLLEHY
jgi:hypothetical protein